MSLLKSKKIKRHLKSYNVGNNKWNLDVTLLSIDDCKHRLNDFVIERECQRRFIESFFENTCEIHLRNLFDKDKFNETTKKLNLWCKNYLLPAYNKKYKNTDFFLSRPFSNDQKILVLISDLGFYFGDVINHHSPTYEWSIIDGLNRKDDYEFQRPVLSIKSNNILDIERLTFQQYIKFTHEFNIFQEAFGKNHAFDEIDEYDKFTGHLIRFFQT